VRWGRAALAAIALSAAGATRAAAQVAPDAEWRTLRTPHFRVHFTPALEAPARRAAASAEVAYARLAAELVPPRGTVDLVVADNVDFSNGFATVFPTNRIVIYAHPPADDLTLRRYDEWISLVVVHELTHIFHLDRSRGLWRLAQSVFGRNPLLFPNTYSPSWLTEGLAVYYESHLTGSGRLAGSQHRQFAQASALGGHVPRLDELSLATPHFPGGTGAYAYGSLLVDYLARERGATRVGAFVERSSGQLIPFRLNRAARRSFGIGFEDAWRQWRDSLRAAATPGLAAPGWRELTHEGWYAQYPRWLDSATIAYAANTAREVPGLYAVGVDGRPRRLARRNSIEPNVPAAGECARATGCPVVFAQLDYVTPYEVRSDLYVGRGARERRLTTGARLAHPDTRRDGAIVAVQAVPATTRLVRVTPDGRLITPLTAASPDTQWAEPRWGPAGDRIAAVRRVRGGRAAVVVLDTLGRALREVAASGGAEQAPSWSPGGDSLYFVSDRSGTSEVYVAALGAATPANGRATAGSTEGSTSVSVAEGKGAGVGDSAVVALVPTGGGAGTFFPAVSADGRTLAAVALRADGFHVGVAPLDGGGAPVAAFEAVDDSVPAPLADSGRVRAYSPWRMLVPRYWAPLVASSDQGSTQLGGTTSGSDIIGRHAYVADALIDTRTPSEVTATATYRYAGLGVPLVDVGVAQSYDHFGVVDQAGNALARLSERQRTLSAALTVARPRFRTSASASLGAEVERLAYAGEGLAALDSLTTFFRSEPLYGSLFLAGAWSNVQRPALSVSPEDGVAVSATTRRRWRSGAGGAGSYRVAGVVRGYKSLDLPGFAHHVVAARLAGAVESGREPSTFDVGGTGGSSIELVPGYSIGDRARTFFVRGFPAGAQRGTRAVGGSVEYRAPLALPARGYSLLPVFLSRLSVTAFADAAEAWCSVGETAAGECERPAGLSGGIASVGAELNVDATLQYDTPYRFRVGVARPVVQPAIANGPVSAYFTVGLAF
jgi:hypothetical protein